MTTMIRPSETKPIARGGVLLSLALALLVAGGGAPEVQGATLYWDANGGTGGTGGSGNWNSTDSTWRDGGPTGPLQAWANNNNANLPSTAGTLTLSENITVGDPAIPGTAPLTATSGYVINGDPGGLYKLIVDGTGGSGAYRVGFAGGAYTINAPVVLQGYNLDTRCSITFNGPISDGDISRTLVVNSGSVLTFNTSNSFSWVINAANGTLVIGDDYGLGSGNVDQGTSAIVWHQAANGNRVVKNQLVSNWNPTFNVKGSYDLRFTTPWNILSGAFSARPTFNVTGTGRLTFDAMSANASYGGGFIKKGTGPLAFGSYVNGNNGGFGSQEVSVQEGALLVNGGFTNHHMVVSSGAALGGSGTIWLASGQTATINGGTITPGGSIGTLTINGDLVFTNAPSYVYEAEDLVDVNGALTLPEEQWNVELIGGLGRSLKAGGSLALFTFDSLANSSTYYTGDLLATYTNWDNPLPVGNLSVSILGNSVILNGVSVVPEPSTIFLLAGGGAVLFGRRRGGKPKRRRPHENGIEQRSTQS